MHMSEVQKGVYHRETRDALSVSCAGILERSVSLSHRRDKDQGQGPGGASSRPRGPPSSRTVRPEPPMRPMQRVQFHHWQCRCAEPTLSPQAGGDRNRVRHLWARCAAPGVTPWSGSAASGDGGPSRPKRSDGGRRPPWQGPEKNVRAATEIALGIHDEYEFPPAGISSLLLPIRGGPLGAGQVHLSLRALPHLVACHGNTSIPPLPTFRGSPLDQDQALWDTCFPGTRGTLSELNRQVLSSPVMLPAALQLPHPPPSFAIRLRGPVCGRSTP
ncbi:hypothetical protein GGR53DRAFT_461969 [Hypoxylon sp. FL1150]|nr:hypothetical protein GGR53DRAFT_461969 [Hypoxylon sp. FL1150]